MSTSSLNRFTHYQAPTQQKMNFWHSVDTNKAQEYGNAVVKKATNNRFSESEDDVDYDSQTEEGQVYEAIQSSLQEVGNKRKAVDTLEPTIDHIKRLATEDTELAKRVKAFYDELLDEKRKLLGDVLCWQEHDDKADKRALLDGTINVIMQARKAMMSKDDEGVTITIEAGGWNDDAHVRPKYAITITRNLQ
jgi:hypothetical protein